MSVDLVTELYQRGLYDILETIIVNIGYAGTANMFLVCPSWRDLLVSMGSWARFTEVKVRSSPKLKHLCRLNGWDRFIPYLTDQKEDFNAKMCPFIFNALTDLSDKIRFKNEINANSEQDMLSDVLRERFFTGGMVTSMIVHNDLTICGMINGQIKIWDTEASDPIIRSKAIKVISAHHDSVVCLDGHQSTLASAARDSRYRLWDLDTGAPMREIKCLNRLVNQISLGADYVLCLYWFELDYMMLSREDTKVVMWTVNGWDNIEQSDEFIMADYSSRPVQLCDLHGQRVIFTDDQQHVSVLDVVDDHLQKTMTIDIGSNILVTLGSSQLPIRTTPMSHATPKSMGMATHNVLNATIEDFGTPIMAMDHTLSPMELEQNPFANKGYLGYGLALDPIQKDLLVMGVKTEGEASYNVHELPAIDGQPVLVEVSVSLRNILEIDEHKQLITLETTLRLYWRDPRLQVDHILGNKTSDYVLLHPDTSKFIWFPDIYIDFAKAIRIPTLIIRPASLRVYRNSTCRYATQINYDVACPMNFQKYPYDTQTCKVKYESYGHTIEKMRVVWKRGFDQSKVTENNYISLAQFEYAVFFEENYEEEIASGVYPGVIMTVLLRRKISYHLLQTYLPSGLFVIVAWLSLFLPPESIPGRVTMAMTTLLTLAAMFGAVSLLNKCQIGGLAEAEEDQALHSRRTSQYSGQTRHPPAPMGAVVSPSSPREMAPNQHHHSCGSIQENNGIRIVAMDGSAANAASPRHFAHVGTDPPVSKLMKYQENRKKRSMFLCCSKKARKSSLRLQKYEIEIARQPRHRRAIPETSSLGRSCCGGSHRSMVQRVEKMCSLFMALSFLLFNGLYWPWLLGDPDFDSAKYSFHSQHSSY
eukprot:snap_masked-scaffold127_size327531-processed-gene-1.4 protein:Tk07873 transcript:snap_masked-scaffold127_size327531-processed-gene-1.4-mRNA-1 annotation:"glycine receptor subunit alpha-2-like"